MTTATFDVTGWLTDVEGQALSQLAEGRVVLEVGSYLGRSTLRLAETAKLIHSVDHHQGDDGTGPADTLDGFRLNLELAEVSDRVVVHVGDARAVLPTMADNQFGLAFIDGSHDEASVRHDAEQARRLVVDGGVVAFHDWGYPSVRAGAAAAGFTGEPDGGADSLAWFVVKKDASTTTQKIACIAMPMYQSGAHPAPIVKMLSNPARTVGCAALHCGGSLLGLQFNTLWCRARNFARRDPRVAYFCMLHADIEPLAPFWLDVLIEELEKHDADMISAVVPIKGHEGLTSTAISDPADPWLPRRRLTMREVFRLPETFSEDDVRAVLGAEEVGPGCLLANTGCMVLRLDRPWADQVLFTIRDRIVQLPDGDFTCEVEPEDWRLSRTLAEAGCRVLATRKVPVHHHGHGTFTSEEPWGDEDDHLTRDYRAKGLRRPVATA